MKKKRPAPHRQGIYKPKHRNKYIGAKHPRYLSSWELRFFRWCDNNPKVLKWGSEQVIIPYQSPVDGKIHRYMVDGLIHLREGNKITKYLIEIKPKKQTKAPTQHGNKKKATMLYEHRMWAVNQKKWEAAEAWSKSHGYKFLILTEDQLF